MDRMHRKSCPPVNFLILQQRSEQIETFELSCTAALSLHMARWRDQCRHCPHIRYA